MSKRPVRIIIRVQDVMNMTGKSSDASQRLLKKVRTNFRKSRKALVTIDEFCTFTGVDRESVMPFMKY